MKFSNTGIYLFLRIYLLEYSLLDGWKGRLIFATDGRRVSRWIFLLIGVKRIVPFFTIARSYRTPGSSKRIIFSVSPGVAAAVTHFLLVHPPCTFVMPARPMASCFLCAMVVLNTHFEKLPVYFSCEFCGAQKCTNLNTSPAFRNPSLYLLIKCCSTSIPAGIPHPLRSMSRNISRKQSTTKSIILIPPAPRSWGGGAALMPERRSPLQCVSTGDVPSILAAGALGRAQCGTAACREPSRRRDTALQLWKIQAMKTL